MFPLGNIHCRSLGRARNVPEREHVLTGPLHRELERGKPTVRLAGVLMHAAGGMEFAYAPHWVMDGMPPLSQSLPLDGGFDGAAAELLQALPEPV